MSVSITHLFPDSPFLPFTVELFEEAAPGRNTFLVYGLRGDLARHALPTDARVEAIGVDAAARAKASAAVEMGRIAVFHSVGAFAGRVLAEAPKGVLKVWSGWGGDYYGSTLRGVRGLLGPETARYLRARRRPAGHARDVYRRVRQAPVLASAARAADVFAAPIPDDFDVFRRRFRGFRGRYAQLNYASVDVESMALRTPSGDGILLGNSADPTNNHVETLALLAEAGVNGRRVVTPLSYGDPAYADVVARRGRELLGSDFLPLRDFLPPDEYARLVDGCSVVVMGHRRQQGLGNVIQALLGGSHVVLHEHSPLARFFAREGVSIRTLQTLPSEGVPGGRPTEDEQRRNRAMIEGFWGRQRVVANVRELITSA
ncbi:TDP-N-acetylfucosamine:lipid II N-acetylfucosaminyltransferase [Microbacterium sp.]|uniref:TDP-N-acetylfucosamine:lipid II N-acetylfucosaminyltransferase n=1 Tax=Microbacterium sp. TaxID=51671 RepID=UPI002B595DC6|nr:TDP-N-acetylfucosamine:lipid II N-acetylfucosaminyltransferase [Microbacterium sp.]HWL77203.1 TDP-N-acetylfucosamine:lipid II N-acetylfucosaminyltransferase [Microbacterium sp.]